jgi:hypothetical protein
MNKLLIYIAVALALAAGIAATVIVEPQAAFACVTGDCSGG